MDWFFTWICKNQGWSGSNDPDNLGHLGHFFGGSSGSRPQTKLSGYHMFFRKQCWHLVNEWTLGHMNAHVTVSYQERRNLWHCSISKIFMSCYITIKKKILTCTWVTSGSHLDCFVCQWVKLVSGCDPFSTLQEITGHVVANSYLHYYCRHKSQKSIATSSSFNLLANYY